MSQPMIILYDVPSNVPQPWVPHAWRIRLILNYKRLPYRTYWVEFPDIEKTMCAIKAPPTFVRPDGQPVYTLPAILDPTRVSPHPVVLTNADKIAEYLEHAYPARPVIPEGTRALQALFVHYITENFVQPLLPIIVPLSHQRLPQHVRNYFRVPGNSSHMWSGSGGQVQLQDTIGIGGPPHLDEQARQRREDQWAVVQAQFTFLARILDKNAGDSDGDGVVVAGHELTHADFAVCAVLIWIEKVAPHEGWARVREWDGGRWWRLWERCKAYMDVF